MTGISLTGKINNMLLNKVEEIRESITVELDVSEQILTLIVLPSLGEINETALLFSIKNCKKEYITINNVFTKEDGEHILYYYCYESSFLNALNFN